MPFVKPPLTALLLSLVVLSCTPDHAAEVGPLEHNLIITWLSLEKGDTNVTTTYNGLAQQDWQQLRTKLPGVLLTDAEKQSVARVSLWMFNLQNAVRYQQQGKALQSLDLLQNELKVLRPRYGIIHPADQLYAFHLSWKRVEETCNDQMMCLLEWKDFEELYEQSLQIWQTYQRSHPNYSDEVFPGHGNNSAAAEAATVALNQALVEFGTLMEASDHTLTTGTAQEIRLLFLDYLAVIVGYPVVL